MGGEGKGHRKKKAGRKAEKRKAAEGKKKQVGGDGAGGGSVGAAVSDEKASRAVEWLWACVRRRREHSGNRWLRSLLWHVTSLWIVMRQCHRL